MDEQKAHMYDRLIDERRKRVLAIIAGWQSGPSEAAEGDWKRPGFRPGGRLPLVN